MLLFRLLWKSLCVLRSIMKAHDFANVKLRDNKTKIMYC